MVTREPTWAYMAMYWRWKRRVLVAIGADIESVVALKKHTRGVLTNLRAIFGEVSPTFSPNYIALHRLITVNDVFWESACNRRIMGMRRGRNGDVLAMSLWCLEEVIVLWESILKVERFYGCRMKLWIKELLFCWSNTGWRENIALKCIKFLTVSMLRRAARVHRRASAMDHPNHRWYYHIEYTSPMFTWAWWEHRRWSCVVDVSACDMFNLYLTECSPIVVRCSAPFGDISPIVFGAETSGKNFNACIEAFLDVPMPWWSMAITCVRRWSFAELLAHGGAALAMTKYVHRESIGRLKKTWPWTF